MAQIHLTPSGSALRTFGQAARLRSRVLGVLLIRSRFDAELAAGADPSSDPARSLRARQLTRPRYRRKLASSLDHLVDDLDSDPGTYVSSAVPFRIDQVAEAREALLALAGALRDVDSVDPHGVAMTLRLLTDSASPLYARAARGAFELKARAALRCLLADSHPWCEFPEAPPLRRQVRDGAR